MASKYHRAVKLSDNEKLRIRFEQTPTRDLLAILERPTATVTERMAIGDALRARGVAVPEDAAVEPSTAAPIPVARPVSGAASEPRTLSAGTLAAVFLGLALPAFLIISRQQRAAQTAREFAAMAEAQRQARDQQAAWVRAQAETQVAFREHAIAVEQSSREQCRSTPSECVRVGELYERGDFEHGIPQNAALAQEFFHAACTARLSAGCDGENRLRDQIAR